MTGTGMSTDTAVYSSRSRTNSNKILLSRSGLAGRPRLVEIYSKLGHRLLASSDGVGQPACTVLACGPMGLVQSAKLACRQDTVAVHFEFHSKEFEW